MPVEHIVDDEAAFGDMNGEDSYRMPGRFAS
jgi:hypothetical protein